MHPLARPALSLSESTSPVPPSSASPSSFPYPPHPPLPHTSTSPFLRGTTTNSGAVSPLSSAGAPSALSPAAAFARLTNVNNASAGSANASSGSSSIASATGAAGAPSNDDIEAVIQMAMASSASSSAAAGRDTRTQLFVGNLPYRVRWQDLKDLFRRAGTVLRADVALGPDNRSRGHGTVLMATAEDGERALGMFQGWCWQGRVLEVRKDRVGEELLAAGTDSVQPSPMALSTVPSPGPPSRYGSSFEADDVLAGVQAFATTNSSGTSSMSGTGMGTPAISRNLFVGNLPFHIQWQDLKDLFRQAGAVSRADVALGADGRSRGFGTVSFSNEADAERAVRMFNGYDYNGRPLKVHFDKFSAPATSAALAVAVPSPHSLSLSSPVSPFPHPHAYSVHGRPVPLAQQILQRSHSDLMHYRTGYEGVQAAGAGDAASGMMRQSPVDAEFAAVHVQARFVQLQGPAVGFEGVRAGQEQQQQQQQQQHLQYQHQAMQPMPEPFSQHHQQQIQHQQHQQQHPTHITMPFPPPYTFEFLSSGPNSPYDIYDMSAGARFGWGMGPGAGGTRYDFGPSAEQAQALQPSVSSFSTLANASGSEEQVAGLVGLGGGGERSAVEAAVIRERAVGERERGEGREEGEYRMPLPQQPSSQPPPQAQEQTTTSPESIQPHSNSAHTHPAHPGPIALPPPPPPSAFPVPPPHTLSPHFFSPVSPLHHPAHALMMGMGMGVGVAMTPHGLPPITPSMPSFTFLPQPSPASAATSTSAASSSAAASASAGAGAPGEQGQGPAPRAMMHVMSPYTPFSPGVTMSPGALWGRPGSGAVNPFLNPAVGAPVHAGSPGGYPGGYYWAAQGNGEPQGYFPPVPVSMAMAQGQGQGQEYFPPVLPSANGNANARSSGLANELHADSGESASSASASASGDTTRDLEGGGNKGVRPTQERTRSENSEATTAGTPGTGTGTGTGTEGSPRPASSQATSWHTDGEEREREVEKRMGGLVVEDGDVEGGEGCGEPVSESGAGKSKVGVEVPVVGVQRAGSDPGEMARVGLGIEVPGRGSR